MFGVLHSQRSAKLPGHAILVRCGLVDHCFMMWQAGPCHDENAAALSIVTRCLCIKLVVPGIEDDFRREGSG